MGMGDASAGSLDDSGYPNDYAAAVWGDWANALATLLDRMPSDLLQRDEERLGLIMRGAGRDARGGVERSLVAADGLAQWYRRRAEAEREAARGVGEPR